MCFGTWGRRAAAHAPGLAAAMAAPVAHALWLAESVGPAVGPDTIPARPRSGWPGPLVFGNGLATLWTLPSRIPALWARSAPSWRRWWQLGEQKGSARHSRHQELKTGWTGLRRDVCYVQTGCRRAGHPIRWCSRAFIFMKGTPGLPFCQWCGKKNTPQHLLYDCKELPGAKPAPKWLLDYRSKVPDVCLWQRGMLPKKYIQSTAEHAVVRDGIFAEEKPPWGRFVYATDASGGRYTKDPRLRHVGWAVIAAVHGPQGLTKVGTLSGVLMNSTVSAGESEANHQPSQAR